jgi:phosphoribosylcarboxyaminoimidazole (NCAIR) mutase
MATGVLPVVGVVMGSRSDWEYMAAAAEVMNELQIPQEHRV